MTTPVSRNWWQQEDDAPRLCCISGNCAPKVEPVSLGAFHGREAKLGPEHSHTIESVREMVNLYESWGKSEEPAKWRAQLPGSNGARE